MSLRIHYSNEVGRFWLTCCSFQGCSAPSAFGLSRYFEENTLPTPEGNLVSVSSPSNPHLLLPISSFLLELQQDRKARIAPTEMCQISKWSIIPFLHGHEGQEAKTLPEHIRLDPSEKPETSCASVQPQNHCSGFHFDQNSVAKRCFAVKTTTHCILTSHCLLWITQYNDSTSKSVFFLKFLGPAVEAYFADLNP